MRNLVRVLVLGMVATGYAAAFISETPARAAGIVANHEVEPDSAPIPQCSPETGCPNNPYIFVEQFIKNSRK